MNYFVELSDAINSEKEMQNLVQVQEPTDDLSQRWAEIREKYPDGTNVIESIGDKITDTICTARREAKKKAKEEKAARRNANRYANQRRNSSSMVQPMKQYSRRAR